MAYRNYQDQLKAGRAWYQKHKKYFIEKKRQRTATNSKIYKEILFEKHGRKCSNCGFDNVAALQFHHKGGKEWNIGYMIHQGWGLERILKEAEKCVVLCANCHFIHHATTK